MRENEWKMMENAALLIHGVCIIIPIRNHHNWRLGVIIRTSARWTASLAAAASDEAAPTSASFMVTTMPQAWTQEMAS